MSVGKAILAGIRWLRGSPRFLTRLITVAKARALLAGLTNEPSRDASPQRRTRQILADVSVIAQKDAGTGIQRVVRELLIQLIDNPPPGFEVRPVYATQWRSYRYADHFARMLRGQERGHKGSTRVEVHAGDIFLGMDLAAHTLPRYPFLLSRWKISGVKFFFIIYDLLPLLHPEWFTASAARAYREWIRTVTIFADGTACISRSVAEEFESWLSETHGNSVTQAIKTSWFHLSGDISKTDARQPHAMDTSGISTGAKTAPTILMVGTIEPRKGYEQALLAFELLWKEHNDVKLVVVGRPGWKMDPLVQRLRNHRELGKRLVWYENASDQGLCELYESVTGLLMASEGEGFGLPLVEIARHGKPILVRDIPVFREIAGARAQYFAGNSPEKLAKELQKWILLIKEGKAPTSEDIGQLQWRDSARQLTNCLTIA